MQDHTTDSTQRRTRTNPFHVRSRRPALLVCVLLLVITAGCTWVPLATDAEDVEVAANQDAVIACKHIGDISSRTKTKVGFIGRNPATISNELTTLARNEAVELGANTILPIGQPSLEGTQKFRAYQCPPG